MTALTWPKAVMIFKRSFPVTRRTQRQWINTSVRVLTPSAHVEALGVNLSEGGMCFFSVANLRVGSQVDIEFRPPQAEEPVRVSGKIRHRALYLYGIEFLSNNSDPDLNTEPHRSAAIQRSSS
jgi:hypothetical protein